MVQKATYPQQQNQNYFQRRGGMRPLISRLPPGFTQPHQKGISRKTTSKMTFTIPDQGLSSNDHHQNLIQQQQPKPNIQIPSAPPQNVEILTQDEEFIIEEFLNLMLEQQTYIRKNNELLLNRLLTLKKQRDIQEFLRKNKDKFLVINDQQIEKSQNDVEITAYKRNIRRALRQRENEDLEEPLRKMRIGRSFQAFPVESLISVKMKLKMMRKQQLKMKCVYKAGQLRNEQFDILKDKLEEQFKNMNDMDVIRYINLNGGNANLGLRRIQKKTKEYHECIESTLTFFIFSLFGLVMILYSYQAREAKKEAQNSQAVQTGHMINNHSS